MSGQNYLSPLALKRLKRELITLKKEEGLNIEVRVVKDDQGNDDISRWDVFFLGSKESEYEGYKLHARINFPPKYPNEPPKFYFKTPLWHPNVYTDGRVCISILHTAEEAMFNEEEKDCTWTAVQTVRTVVISILSLLNDPNINSPANVDAAKQFRDDPDGFKKQVASTLEANCEKCDGVFDKK